MTKAGRDGAAELPRCLGRSFGLAAGEATDGAWHSRWHRAVVARAGVGTPGSERHRLGLRPSGTELGGVAPPVAWASLGHGGM